MLWRYWLRLLRSGLLRLSDRNSDWSWLLRCWLLWGWLLDGQWLCGGRCYWLRLWSGLHWSGDWL